MQLGALVPSDGGGSSELQLFPVAGAKSVTQAEAKVAQARARAYGPVVHTRQHKLGDVVFIEHVHVPSKTHLRHVSWTPMDCV